MDALLSYCEGNRGSMPRREPQRVAASGVALVLRLREPLQELGDFPLTLAKHRVQCGANDPLGCDDAAAAQRSCASKDVGTGAIEPAPARLVPGVLARAAGRH